MARPFPGDGIVASLISDKEHGRLGGPGQGAIEFFARWLYFYDAVNNNFTEYHPNRVTRQNYQQVGFAPGDRGFVNTGDPVTTAILRNLVYFPNNRIYGAGGVVRNRRTDGETLKQVGTDLQLLDAVLSGKFTIPGDRTLTVKPSVIEDASLEANPQLTRAAIAVTCEHGLITEARICLTKDLTPRPCSADAAPRCPLPAAEIDAVR